MNTPTGKIHELRTLGQLLSLSPDEFERMLPDLRGWHELARHCVDLLGTDYEDFEKSAFIWTDDGEPGIVNSARITIGDQTIDLVEELNKGE